MPASDARILANQLNSLKSTGPKTPEGKEASRANAYKHGLTATTVLPEREAAEVERRYLAFCDELQPSGEVGMALARQAAMMSVRTERCFDHEIAKLAERVRQAEADFVPPKGVDAAESARLRAEAGKLALFDPSKEATLARQYEAAAHRGFFRALKELRAVERAARVADDAIGEQYYREALASFSQTAQPVERSAPAKPSTPPTTPPDRFDATFAGPRSPFNLPFDVPFAIGKPR